MSTLMRAEAWPLYEPPIRSQSQVPLIAEAPDPEQQEFIRGSPRIALELANPLAPTYLSMPAGLGSPN